MIFPLPFDPFFVRAIDSANRGTGEREIRLILYPMEEKYGESVSSLYD
jgi:hypothetical protein